MVHKIRLMATTYAVLRRWASAAGLSAEQSLLDRYVAPIAGLTDFEQPIFRLSNFRVAKVGLIYDGWDRTKCGAGRICWAELNGDNLRISRVYLRISDHRRVTVRVWVMVRVRVRNMVRVSIRVRVSVRVADCCIQTARKVTKCGSIT